MHARDWGDLLPELGLASFVAAEGRDRDRLARLERAHRLIEADPGAELDLQRLARAACLSPFHFARLYQQLYGKTPHHHLTERRLERARVMLAREGATVTEACFAVGFSSVGSFSRLFKRHLGEPPSAYRRRWVQVAWQRLPPVPSCFLERWFGVPAQDRKIG